MSDETTTSPEASADGEARIPVDLRYEGASRVQTSADGAQVALFGNAQRDPVRAVGTLRDPLKTREALSVLYEVVKSDFRYVPRDRTAYLAYQRMRNQSSSAGAFEAQREYFEWLRTNDPNAWLILDPLITVHPDGLLCEVFSKDEGSYARLSLGWEGVELDGEVACGTTNIDYSEQLFAGVQQLRSYRDTKLAIAPDEVALQTEDQPGVIEKQINLPASWLRGFLQVQSSATLPLTRCTIAPIDLYNVLRHLRLNADQKRGGRAIRVELVPGEYPRMVLEPWEEVITTTHAPYQGRVAQVIRIWGRRRLMLLRRLLPFVDSVELCMLGTGLPSFYVLRCGALTFTMGLTGFTSSNWSQALSLDTLLPRTHETTANLDRVLGELRGRWMASLEDLEGALGLDRTALRDALRLGCQHGQIMYDLADDVYRYRPVMTGGLDLDKLEFRNARERLAHDLINGRGGSVTIESENRIAGVGVQYVATVKVDADRREYRAELTIDEEGRVKRADCTSSFYRKHQLKEGPSAPLIALRLRIALDAKRRAEERGADTITFETRTYVRRHDRGEDVVQVSLEQRHLKVKWGLRTRGRLRAQNLVFNTVDEAREAYFARVRDIERRGYMDATAAT